MKKLSFSLLAMLGLFATVFISCSDDDDEPPLLDPVITDIDPNTGPVGTPVTISGANFGSNPIVNFGSTQATISNSSTTEITTSVPSGLSAGAVQVTVNNDGSISAGSTFTVTEDNPPTGGIANVADTAATIDDVSTLVAALGAAEGDLVSALNGDGPFTVFAPNNAAFEALLAALGASSLDDVVAAVGADGLSQVLRAHVIPDSLPADLIQAQDYTTLNDSTITITVDGDNVFANGAQVIGDQIIAGNGVIHVIDSVINLPPVGDAPTTRVDITDADLVAGETYNWTANNEYFLTGLVYVEGGATLNIEAGTTVRFTEETGDDNTSALIVTQGSQINAVGTADAPIIFTAEADTADANLLPTDWGLWGGVILLGNAPAEKDGITSGISIEGVDSDEARAVYGGADPADNSGTLQYVSIRYTGVGIAPNSEIQGLTLGGVGSGTTIDHIDVYSSNDDGIEIFGGTVNITYASVAFATDDAFDFDEGWRGSLQFGFVIQTDADYDQVGEWDGAIPDDAALFSAPNVYNVTLIGPGQSATGAQRALIMRDAFAGKLGNSIIEDFPGIGIQVEDIDGDIDSYARVTNPVDGYQVEILNNTWAQFGGYVEAEGLSSLVQETVVIDDKDTEDTSDDEITFTGVTEDVVAELEDNNNDYSATGIVTSISRLEDGGLDPRPAAATAATATVPSGMEQVDYRGAFAPGESTWLAGWSTLSQRGILFE